MAEVRSRQVRCGIHKKSMSRYTRVQKNLHQITQRLVPVRGEGKDDDYNVDDDEIKQHTYYNKKISSMLC